MKRRGFLTASAGVVGLAGLGTLPVAANGGTASAPAGKLLYELRLYRIASADKRKAMERFFAEAAVPAWNRLGVEPVGVFRYQDEQIHDLWVLLPYRSFDTCLAVHTTLLDDEEFCRRGAAVLGAAIKDPAYQRVESSLLLAFDQMPQLEIPARGPDRVLQLRIYESHSLERARKKIAMFNEGGEIAVFRKTGLTPVFFGQSLVGSKLPNLTYMLGFENDEARQAAWQRFLEDPAWLALKGDEQYKDTVSNITNLLLRPAAGSQI